MLLKELKKMERFPRYACRAFLRDTRNRIVHGPEAPRYAERIWVNPQECAGCLVGLGDRYSGRVITGPWPPRGGRFRAIVGNEKVRSCLDHWVKGVPWEETGIFDFLERKIENSRWHVFDDCRNREDIEKRYAKLDRVFEKVRKEGALKINSEVDSWAFREKDGVYFHVGPGGCYFFGSGGCHRFAMSLALGLTRIPAKIGCVHISAIPHLKSLRRR